VFRVYLSFAFLNFDMFVNYISTFIICLGEVGGQIGRQAQSVADTVAEHGSKLASTPQFRAVSGAAAVVRDEIVDANSDSRIYKPPAKLRKRVEVIGPEAIIEPNDEARGMELHKDSRYVILVP